MKKIILLLSVLITTITYSQNVGISTSTTFTPTERLDVDGNLLIRNNTGVGVTSISSLSRLYVESSTSSLDAIRGNNTSTSTTASYGGVRGSISGTGYTSSAAYLAFHSTTNKTFAVYGNSGDYGGWFSRPVGIGSNQPTTSSDLEIVNISGGSPSTLLLRQSSSNSTSGAILSNISFGDNYTTSPQAQIQVTRGAAGGSSSDLPTDMIFSTTSDASSILTERMRITNSGNIGIGTTSPTSLLSVGSSSQFQVNSSGDIVKIKNVTYSWPSSNGTTNSFLTTDASGNLSWRNIGSAQTMTPNLFAYSTTSGYSVSSSPITISVTTTSATDRVLLMGNWSFNCSGTSGFIGIGFKRGTTLLNTPDITNRGGDSNVNLMFIDTPGSAGTFTYTLDKWYSTTGPGTITTQGISLTAIILPN